MPVHAVRPRQRGAPTPARRSTAINVQSAGSARATATNAIADAGTRLLDSLSGMMPAVCWRISGPRRTGVAALLVVNTAVSAMFALPLIPVDEVGSTPVAAANQTVGDQIGRKRYVRQVADVAVTDGNPNGTGTFDSHARRAAWPRFTHLS